MGPKANGYLRPLDEAMLLSIGEWANIQSEALYLPRPTGISVEGNNKNFILGHDGAYYLFCHDIKIEGDINVTIGEEVSNCAFSFKLEKDIRSMCWIDDGSEVAFEQKDGVVTVLPSKFSYGTQLVVRIAKIEV